MAKKPPKPQKPPILDVEVANRLRDPFETFYLGVLRTNDPLLLERGAGGSAAYDLYRDLLRDGKVFAGLQKRKLAVIGRPWQVEPVEDDGHEDAEMVTEILKRMNFDAACLALMDALLYGFVPAEIIWTVCDGLIVPERLITHRQRRFTYVQDDYDTPPELRMLTREEMIRGVELPDKKFIVHRVNPDDDNPYGTGLGLQLYWPVFFKRKGVVSWNKLNDRFGSPTPHGKYPNNAGPKDRQTLFDALRALSDDGVIMTPEGMAIELLESKVSGNVTTQQKLVEYMDDWISEVLLGQSPRGGSGGALAAAANEREQVRIELSQADSDLLSETLNRTLLKWICEFNGLAPCQVYRVIKADEDLKAASETDVNVQSLGFKMSLDGARAKYGEHWELAEPTLNNAAGPNATSTSPSPTGEEPAAPPDATAEAPEEGDDEPPAAEFAEPRPLQNPDTADKMAPALASQADAQVANWLDQIEAMLAQAGSLEEFRAMLLASFNDLPADDLVEVMSAALAAIELRGRAEVLGGQ